MKAWLIPISLVLLANPAHADQCEWIDNGVAVKAQAILKKSPTFIDYCEPCGDPAPGAPQQATTVNLITVSEDSKQGELWINGKAIDLAYVFVKTSEARYENLASLAGCPATGVSPSLAIEAETRTGVLISGDDKPAGMTAVTEVPSYQYKPAVADPLPAPAQVYVYKTVTHEIAWLPLLLAAAGGLVTGSALTMLLLAIRRRHAMRPRAVDIGR
jgi:hypothetical protein